MARFRKKPVVINAVKWTGHNEREVEAFCGEAIRDKLGTYAISTLEGELTVSVGDWIIKGVNGEFYPCKPDIFAKTYEPVEAL